MGASAMQRIRRYGLASACLAAPIFAFLAVFGPISVLMQPARIDCISLGYQFRDHDAPKTKTDSAPGEKSDGTKAATPALPKAEPAKGAGDTAWPIGSPAACENKPDASPPAKPQHLSTDPSVKLDLVARHFSGIIGFGIGTAMLWIASVALFAFAAGVILTLKDDGRRNVAGTVFGPAVSPGCFFMGTVVVTGIFAAAGAIIFRQTPQLQLLVFKNVFDIADAHPWVEQMKISAHVLDFVTLNIFFGIWAVGMWQWALFCAAVRPLVPDNPTKELLPALSDYLIDRMSVIRTGVIVASILLVINVVTTKALVDWPLSLLTDDARQALAPAGNIIVQQWGVLGTLALIAAVAPAIIAWHLDRQDYRARRLEAANGNTPPPAATGAGATKSGAAEADAGKPPAKPGQGKSDDAQPADDGLEVKLVSMITSVVALLAPMIASPLLSGLQSLFSLLSK